MKNDNDHHDDNYITLDETASPEGEMQIEKGESTGNDGFYVVGDKSDLITPQQSTVSDWQKKTRQSIEKVLEDMHFRSQHIEMSPVSDLYLFRVVGSARFSVRISTQSKLGTCLIMLYLPVEVLPAYQSLLMLKLTELNEKLPFGKYIYRHDSGEVLLTYQCTNTEGGITISQIRPVLTLLVNHLIRHEDEILRYARGVFSKEEKIRLLMGLTQQIKDLSTPDPKQTT